MKKLKITLPLILSSFILLIAFSSCKKELNPSDNPSTGDKTMNDLVVSESFDFATSQTINIKVTASDYVGLPATKIEIFNGNPNETGTILKSGITDKNQVFETSIVLPAYHESVYIRRITYDGVTETATVDITGANIEHVFLGNKSVGDFKSGETGPGCTSCTTTIADHQNGTLDVKNNKTYCILSGGSFTGEVKLNGGTLKVCGTLTLTNLTGSKGTIIINDEGVFISNNLNLDKKDMVIENYSDAFIVSSAPNLKGKIKNWGNIALAGANINKDGEFYNYGVVAFSNSYNNNETTYNEGIFNIAGSFNNNNDGLVENHCAMNIAGNFNNNDDLKNYSYMNINGTLTLNNNGKLKLYNQALVEVANLMVNEDIEGYGDLYSKIIISGNTTINGNGKLKGKLDVCDENGIETDNGETEGSVTFCEASIPETYCNPGSNNGGGSGPDSDNDGVADEFDDYPNDSNRAFNNYFPDENNFGTLAFEDLWPYKGDYDFNDLVVDYRFNTVTNSDDNAVEVFVTLKVRAIGAAYKNGFGIQLPVSPDAVNTVSGDFSFTQNIVSLTNKNLEANQDKAVVVFFDNAFNLLPHAGDGTGVNTRLGSIYVDPQEINFLISFAYPINPVNLGEAPFNPFIFVNGDRGREVHLKNHAPTDLVDNNLFGTGQDVSVPGSGLYYKTENNLPWGINLINNFEYPIEKAPIINAYLHFGDWAESGGTLYTDWYTDQPGYRNSSNIFTH